MANKANDTLGEVLFNARAAAKLSLRALAKRLRISPSYISDIENGRRTPADDVLEQLAHHLRLDLDDLVARTGRLSGPARRYLHHHPLAAALFRIIAERRAPDEVLRRLIEIVEEE